MLKVFKRNPITAIVENYGGLPRSIYILFIARIINRIGGFVHAFLPLYLKSKLGMTEGQIADYILLNGALIMMGPFIGGYIADRKGRKMIYLLAQGGAALLFIPCGVLTETHPHVIPVLLIGASLLNSLVGPVNSAMVADIARTTEERKRAFALLYLGINVGVAIGPMIGGFLLANHVRWFFYGDAITTLIGLVLIWLFVEETMLTKEEMHQVEGNEKMESGFVLGVLFKKPIILLFTFFAIFNSMVYAQSGFGFSLYMDHLFGPEQGPKNFGFLMSFNAVTVLIFTIMVTELLKKVRPVYNIALASVFYAIGFGMKGYIDAELWYFAISVFIWTIGEIVSVTNQSVFIMAHTPVNYRGQFNAIIGFLTGAGYVISPKIMSYAIEEYGYQSSWKMVGVVALFASIGFVITGIIDKTRKSRIGLVQKL